MTTRAATGVPVPADDERYNAPGIFTITVAEAVDSAEQGLRQ